MLSMPNKHKIKPLKRSKKLSRQQRHKFKKLMMKKPKKLNCKTYSRNNRTQKQRKKRIKQRERLKKKSKDQMVRRRKKKILNSHQMLEMEALVKNILGIKPSMRLPYTCHFQWELPQKC